MQRFLELVSAGASNPYISAAVITVASLIAATIVDVVVTRVSRVLTSRTSTTFDDRLVEYLHQPVRTTVVMIGLWLATMRLQLPPYPVSITLAMLKTITVIVWMVFAIRFVGLVLSNMSASTHFNFVEVRTQPLFENVLRVVIIGAALYFIFLFWGIEVTAWLASAGVVGIAVGFAAKDTLANLFSGIFILADAPYKVGDYINLDGGERGQVTHIGLRSTRLLTRDDVEITLPNAVIANAKIINESGGPSQRHRIRVRVGVAYGSDIDRVREILDGVAAENPHACDEPAPRVRFRQFGESSLDFDLMCWIEDPGQRGLVIDQLNTAIYKGLAAGGIEIPYPKRDVYIKERPGG